MYAPFVATLFSFLETRGISQADVARTLGLQRTSTNFWAKGTRPISRGHAWRFGKLVYDQLVQMCADGNTMPAWEVVGPWSHELADTNGVMEEQVKESVWRIAELILMAPSKLATGQLQDYRLAFKRGEAALNAMIRRRGEAPFGDVDRHWFSIEDPLEDYKRLWRMCGIDLDQPEPIRRDHHAA
jgi:hypothetical protein